jgi:hypothetical protein
MLLPGWPRQLRVVAAKPFAPNCRVHGRSLCGKATIVGNPSEVNLYTFDQFGNAVNEGGHSVTARLSRHDGSGEQQAHVLDNGDGSYRIVFNPEWSGILLLQTQVNGVDVFKGGVQITAEWGPLAA